MASVYRAEHALLNKQVALKVMAPALHASAEARQRFLREARAVAAIQHPNVVSISDAGLFEGTPYLVMELLDGEDLEQHLQHHGPFAASELPAIALPIVAALAAAHDAGVIHRDLKPGNIFLARGSEGDLVPKLLDFGISKFASSGGPPSLAVTAFDQLMGSPLYLPPEALQGSRELTARSDQYSLGVVLYECVTGQAPFYRDDLVPLLNAICEGSCPAPRQLRPDTPAALEHAILRAMSVEPLQRFGHIRELGQALLELAEPETRQRWSLAFAARDGRATLPPAASGQTPAPRVVTLVPPPPAVSPAPPPVASAVSPVPSESEASRAGEARRKRRRLVGAWALLASGCLLLGLALVRVRSSGTSMHRAQLSALDPLGTISHAPASHEPGSHEPGSHELGSHEPGSHELSSHGASVGWQRSATPTAPGSLPRPPMGLPPPSPAPVVAVVPPEATAAAGAGIPASATGTGAASAPAPKRRTAPRRASEAEVTRELGQLFFPETAGEKTTATRGRAAPQTAQAPVPLLVNEAPLFD